jgi:D-sedoheptulose 7-phosphate isomerase
LREIIDNAYASLQSSVAAAESQKETVARAARAMADALSAGGSILICGNGGSAAEAQHFAAELVGRFLTERPGLPALSLGADTAKLTAIGNDYGFSEVFARQVAALGRPGDVLWAISTSGLSPNVLRALAVARERGLATFYMCGRALPDPSVADIVLYSPAPSVPRIQELHLFYGHLICELIDAILFSPARA